MAAFRAGTTAALSAGRRSAVCFLPQPTSKVWFTTLLSSSRGTGLAPSRQQRARVRALPIVPSTSQRLYHSYDHPMPESQFNSTEAAILAAAYKHVPSHGFTLEALALGAREAGYLDISTNLFPDGAFALIQWHLVTQRQALASRSADPLSGAGSPETLDVLNKAEALTWERLLGNAAAISRLQEAFAIMAQPSYIPASLKELALLADEIWFLAGDGAVDPSWYTKRASLSALYAATELFMTSDRSHGFQDTRAFLGRRFSEFRQASGTMSSIGEWLGFTATASVQLLRSKGVRI